MPRPPVPSPALAVPNPMAQQLQHAEVLYQTQLEQLRGMGFTNHQANLRGEDEARAQSPSSAFNMQARLSIVYTGTGMRFESLGMRLLH